MSAHHRHQASLEHILDFSSPQPFLSADEFTRAKTIFTNLMSHCEPVQSKDPYKKVTLAGSTYEYAQSKEIFLHQFFVFLDTQQHPNEPPHVARGISRFSSFGPATSTSEKKEAEKLVDLFGESLFTNFFSPLKASGKKTPQPTPALSSVPMENAAGTTSRLSILRRDCLIRDHHRCVVSRAFDAVEAPNRAKINAQDPRDDDGQPVDPDNISYLEVAHIMPHSLMSAGGNSELTESKRNALVILRMFDPNIVHLIEGVEIDRPTNAITLTTDIHRYFGEFKFYFEEMGPTDYPPHTYRVTSKENVFARPKGLPVTRTLFLSPNHTIDPPSAKLLAIHRAISIILHLSGAGEYIDEIIRDMEEINVRADGSTELSHIVSMKLGGWFDVAAA